MSTVKTKGIHHVALKAKGYAAFEKMMHFYHDLLGMPVVRTWGAGDDSAAMLDTGDGGMLEIFEDWGSLLPVGGTRALSPALAGPL